MAPPLTINDVQEKELQILDLLKSLETLVSTGNLKEFEVGMAKFFIDLETLSTKKNVELRYRQSSLKKLEILQNGIEDLISIIES